MVRIYSQCNNGDYYKGCTNDLDKRLAKHQQGKVPSTCKDLPVEMVSYVAFTDKHQSFKFEKYLKSGCGRAFLKKRLV